jgi:hypothetical protein
VHSRRIESIKRMEGIESIDLFVVPTIAFQQLFVFLVLGHERRRLLWFAVTRNPTAEWLARQITKRFLGTVHRNISFATTTEHSVLHCGRRSSRSAMARTRTHLAARRLGLNEAGWCCGDLAIQIDFRAFGGRAVIQRTSLQCPSLDPGAVMGRPADHRLPIQIFRTVQGRTPALVILMMIPTRTMEKHMLRGPLTRRYFVSCLAGAAHLNP